ncbi:MAG: hypothetical protein MI919_13735 [Holophagales bacterium]|nr:hypothetical protein [Holophagales bacterium]
MDSRDIFEPIAESITPADVGHTTHSNTHCNALVENPFAWGDEDETE